MTPSDPFLHDIPEKEIDIVEPGGRARKNHVPLDLLHDIRFSTTGLESYSFARWQTVTYDAMVVAAAIEYGDRIVKRPPRGWARRISLRIPVHDLQLWESAGVSSALHDAIDFLTGDYWSISFIKRSNSAPSPSQDLLSLSVKTKAVIPFSDGMDSRAVAGIVGVSLGDALVRVRVGSKKWDVPEHRAARKPFTMVPYDVPCDMPNRESSARSRGFKFALISGIAAYLTDADEVIMPESGQGALGPALLRVGHAYPDYRNHPLFTSRMQCFFSALLNKKLTYSFPRLWHTKGETLRAFADLSGNWESTRSCWRNNQWSSVNGKLRQCGVCAACMLRRVAVHAAGLSEATDTYVANRMGAPTLEKAVDPAFTRLSAAYREYAIAGFLHMHHLAEMAGVDSPAVRTHAALLAHPLGLSPMETCERLRDLLSKHAKEWNDYMKSLGPNSFLTKWAQGR